jgi:hypothetical protein
LETFLSALTNSFLRPRLTPGNHASGGVDLRSVWPTAGHILFESSGQPHHQLQACPRDILLRCVPVFRECRFIQQQSLETISPGFTANEPCEVGHFPLQRFRQAGHFPVNQFPCAHTCLSPVCPEKERPESSRKCVNVLRLIGELCEWIARTRKLCVLTELIDWETTERFPPIAVRHFRSRPAMLRPLRAGTSRGPQDPPDRARLGRSGSDEGRCLVDSNVGRVACPLRARTPAVLFECGRAGRVTPAWWTIPCRRRRAC